jgi:hypothetical protein
MPATIQTASPMGECPLMVLYLMSASLGLRSHRLMRRLT